MMWLCYDSMVHFGPACVWKVSPSVLPRPVRPWHLHPHPQLLPVFSLNEDPRLSPVPTPARTTACPLVRVALELCQEGSGQVIGYMNVSRTSECQDPFRVAIPPASAAWTFPQPLLALHMGHPPVFFSHPLLICIFWLLVNLISLCALVPPSNFFWKSSFVSTTHLHIRVLLMMVQHFSYIFYILVLFGVRNCDYIFLAVLSAWSLSHNCFHWLETL